ncbi:MAG: PAS domain-containing protein, partial [Chitinivibrionales bacterium]|nr:PAS domain-containing protein [Chitinivibrionales bacterium]MBD3396765.1 PAS domain-containing protein [Chitinivibrionales bacterium]
ISYANDSAMALLREWDCAMGDPLDESACRPLANAVKAGSQKEVEVNYGDKWCSLAVVPVPGQSYLNVYGRDISEAREIQEALKVSEQRYRLAQRAANIGTWEWHIKSGDVHWSEHVGPLFGLEPGQFQGTFEAFMDLVHPDDRARITAAVESSLQTGAEYSVEHRIVRPDGTQRWMLEVGAVVRDADGSPERMIGIVRDITGQREATGVLENKVDKQANMLVDAIESLERMSEEKEEVQEELTQRQQALEAIYAIASTFGTSLEATYDQIVTSLADILAAPFVAVVLQEGNRMRIASLFERGAVRHDSPLCPHGSPCEQIVNASQVLSIANMNERNYPSQSCFARYSFSSYLGIPIRAHDVPALGAICVMDKEGREFEPEEVHLVEIFARYVSRELMRVRMERELRQSEQLKRLGQLTSGVAHEVRNPLNAILAIIEALFQDIGDNPEYQPYLEHIRNQGNRLSTLMSDLLELGRPVNTAAMRPLSVRELVEGSVDMWRKSSQQSGHSVQLDVHPEADRWTVNVDTAKMQQALFNLIENACSHSQKDSPVLIRAVAPEGNRVGIVVEDRGSGIAPEHLATIFDPFFTTRKHGTGLGLSIVRHIVQLHGGEVSLRNNEPPPGVTALVRLPLHEIRQAGQ